MNVDVDGARDNGRRHVAGFYDQDAGLVSAVAKSFTDALDRNGSAVAVTTDAHGRAIEALLASGGHAIDELIEAGRYRRIDAREMLSKFMAGNAPDPRRFASVVGAALDEVAASGGPVQVFGEMVALLWDQGNVDGAIQLEVLWNELATRYDFALFCAYTMSSLEASADLWAAKRVCEAHTSLIAIDERPPDSDDVADGSVERLFIPSPEVLRSVRQFVLDSLRDTDDEELLSRIEIVTSELATNAVMHARSPFRVSISRSASSVTIAVRDTSFELPEHAAGHTDRAGGRGVGLVAAFSAAWGIDEEPDGKTVWAEIAKPRR